MNRHHYFDLWLHSDFELEALVGESLGERHTLHEWPLSCIQRLATTSGRRLIYKSQARPSVEIAF